MAEARSYVEASTNKFMSKLIFVIKMPNVKSASEIRRVNRPLDKYRRLLRV